jgi:hypothetical protein
MTRDGVQGFSGAGPETGESSDEEGHAEVLEKVFSLFVQWLSLESIGSRLRSASRHQGGFYINKML